MMLTGSTLRKNIFFPLWILKNRSKQLEYMKKYEKLQWQGKEDIERIQFDKLKELLVHSYNNTQYYNRIFNQIDFNPKDLNTFTQFQMIPILTKDIIQKESDRFIAKGYKKETMIQFKTGGSTGKALNIFADLVGLDQGVAFSEMCFLWTGWDLGQPIGRIWGNPPFPKTVKQKLYNYFIQPVIFLDTMSLNESSMNHFIEKWVQVKPTLLHGHSHSLYRFALFLKSKKIFSVKPRAIISTSMMLLSHERSVIEEVFGIKITNLYGCEEVGLIACECEKHEGLHLNTLNLIIEFIKDDGSVAPPGEEGNIVVTSLINYGMPLIRYKIEDVGIPSVHICSCGRGLPLMEKISGRVADFLVKQDGSLVQGVSLIERTLTKIKGLIQMQIVQEDIETININIVVNNDFDEESGLELVHEFQKVFGEKCKISIHFKDKIEQEKSGKYRFSICKIKN